MNGLGADCCTANNSCYQCTAEEAQQLAEQQQQNQDSPNPPIVYFNNEPSPSSPIPFEPYGWDPLGDPNIWLPATPVSSTQPPVIALNQPPTAAGSAGAGTGAAGSVMDWLKSEHAVLGYHVPTWAFLAAAAGAVVMMSSKGKAARARK